MKRILLIAAILAAAIASLWWGGAIRTTRHRPAEKPFIGTTIPE